MKQYHFLLCTDLDRTLIPNGPEPESPGARDRFAALAAHEQVTLAYVSGRHRALVEEAIAEYGLPQPDFVIGDVGTTIYRVGTDNLWLREHAWEEKIGRDWAGKSGGEIAVLLDDLSELRLQEASKQNRYKLSFYLPLQADGEAVTGEIERRLQQAGVKARLIRSVDAPAGVGLLDIVPEQASKFHAISELISGHEFDLEWSLFCGDSGNDIEVLASAIPSVLVANASDEVRAQALKLAAENGVGDRLYLAHGGFLKMNGNYAAGILEGVAHFHPEVVSWMQLVEPEESV